MRNLLVFIGLWLAVSSCGHNSLETRCYHGQVLMSSCCTGSTFIAIDTGFPIGKPMGNYPNVIQVPGYLNNGDIYLKLRDYNKDKDSSLFPPIYCYCLVAVGPDVPVFVATSFSYTSCPGNFNLTE